MKSQDFNEIKEITDFNQFSKESLLPFGVCNEQISSDNLQQISKQISMFWSISCGRSIKLHICSFSGKSIPNLKSTRSCPSVFKANFVHCSQINFFPVETVYKMCRNSVETVSTKTNTNSLWKLTQPFSSHSVIPFEFAQCNYLW